MARLGNFILYRSDNRKHNLGRLAGDSLEYFVIGNFAWVVSFYIKN